MRIRALRFLALFLAIGLVVPLFAQQPGRGFGGGITTAMLCGQKSVQEEVKLTEDQIAKVKKATDEIDAKYKDDRAKAFKDKDKDKQAEIRTKVTAETTKALADILKPEQAKRIKEIEIQLGGLDVLGREEIAKDLKLTDKQKEDLKGRRDDLNKDRGDIFKDAGRDPAKFAEASAKVRTLSTEAAAKFVSTLTDEQKAAYKDMTGKKFEGKLEFMRPGRPQGDK
jgi:hypothetical protein